MSNAYFQAIFILSLVMFDDLALELASFAQNELCYLNIYVYFCFNFRVHYYYGG